MEHEAFFFISSLIFRKSKLRLPCKWNQVDSHQLLFEKVIFESVGDINHTTCNMLIVILTLFDQANKKKIALILNILKTQWLFCKSKIRETKKILAVYADRFKTN